MTKLTIAAYKVRDADGNYAIGSFYFSPRSKGRTWVTRNALNASFRSWLDQRRFLHDDGVYRPRIERPRPMALPSFWTVIELTEAGLREVPAQTFYMEKRR
jgi:hypothetical protein